MRKAVSGIILTLMLIEILMLIPLVQSFQANFESFPYDNKANDFIKKSVNLISSTSNSNLVLAFYYGWYGTPYGPIGSWFHWAGGYDRYHNPEDIYENGTRDIPSNNYPSMDVYDSHDLAVLENHIYLAKSAGIDGFLVSCVQAWKMEFQTFELLLNISANLHFQVTVFYETPSAISIAQEHGLNPVLEVQSDVAEILTLYSSKEGFLKYEGKPIIFFYSAGSFPVNDWSIIFSYARNQVPNALFIGDIFDIDYLSVFDGLFTYSTLGFSNLTSTYSSISKDAHALGKLFAATVCPGFDNRRFASYPIIVPRNDGLYYNETWEAALLSSPDMITITTFNEWHEDTEIEPSIKYGHMYLDLTSYYTSIYKQAYEPKGLLTVHIKAPKYVLPNHFFSIQVTIVNNESYEIDFVSISLHRPLWFFSYRYTAENLGTIIASSLKNYTWTLKSSPYDEETQLWFRIDCFGINSSDYVYTYVAFSIIISPVSSLSVSISPLSASISVGQSVTFTSTVSGGYPPYSYQWYLNDSIVSGAASNTWKFTPLTIGTYRVYLNVTDSSGNVAISDTATITVASQLIMSISPMSASILVDQSVTFTSTTSGGYSPYTYQWFLNGNPVSGATSANWTFKPTTSGIFYVHLKVTDAKGNTAQSDAARIIVSTVSVGGYSIPIQLPTTAKPATIHIALLTILTAIFITIKQRTIRKHRQ